MAAAIALLDQIAAGEAAEKALTTWGRKARYAGSKDRAAVRDHVFDALRMWRSSAVAGGAETGRARMIGLLRLQGVAPSDVFTGVGHAPARLSVEEAELSAGAVGAAAWDLPDWLAERFAADLGAEAAGTAEALRHRADVFLRVNTLKTSRDEARARLQDEGVTTEPHPLAPQALRILTGARGVTRTSAWQDGWVELQDVASQAVVDALPDTAPRRILDYCAGGGGKALALAARWPRARIEAHDAVPKRMVDVPARSARAGARITCVPRPKGHYDLVVCDAPCSGSGAWRRAPEGKWRLTEARLAELVKLQAEILTTAAEHVSDGGQLVYATCSVLDAENSAQVQRFIQHNPVWRLGKARQFLPKDGGDGFFVATLEADRSLV